MQETPQYSTLLTDLDCIFDTRLGTLVNLDIEIAEKMLEEDKYFERLEDSFLTIDKETFYSYYHRRNKLILANSPLTRMLQFIQEFILGTMKNAINSPYKFDPRLIVNVYPYRLTDDEKNRILKNLIYLTNEACLVELIDKDPLDIEPLYVKNEVAMWVTYEYSQWLEKYSKNRELEKHMMPDVGLIVPSIYFNFIPGNKEKAEYAKIGMGPFEALEFTCKPLIGLKVVKLNLFCIDTKYYKEEEETDEPECTKSDDTE